MFPFLSINWTSPFPILGLLGGFYHFIQILKETSVSNKRFAASDLVLHCLQMSLKEDARFIWVKDD